MERINNSNTLNYSPAEIFIGTRKPFNKNTLWIFPKNDGNTEIRIFNKGWKSILNTEDKGLSKVLDKQVTDLLESNYTSLDNSIKKHISKFSSNSLLLIERNKKLENKLNLIQDKLDKLTIKYQTLLTKINSNGK